MLKTQTGNHGRRWARRSGAAALALATVAAWMSACGDDPAGIGVEGEPASLTVIPALAEPLAVGDEVELSAALRDAGGKDVADPVVWTSSNPRVAVVGPKGLLKALAPGTAGITAVAGGVSATVQFSVASPDRAVLEALYHVTGGPDWANGGNWLTDAPLNEWHGVTTDSVGRVVALDLSDNRLAGDIPAELGDLDSLERLYLQRNGLTGKIPAELGGLAKLEQLYLQRNGLTGKIPAEFGGLANLHWLLLNHNQLMGWIPAELGDLAHLEGLLLHSNPELSGSLPLALASLSGLQLFRYDATGVCVPADESFRAWLNAIPNHRGTGVDCAPEADRAILEALYHATVGTNWTNSGNWLSNAPLNEWHGVTTDSVGRVVRLDLGENRLVGGIPAELAGLVSLEGLDLQDNQLTGEIPSQLGDLASLEWLHLSRNQLTGNIPAELGQLVSLGILDLRFNQLTGNIPAELGQLARLRSLLLRNNRLTGDIPAELGQLASLEALGLTRNQLTGDVPVELGQLANLEGLSLYDNQLTGDIPVELAELASLAVLFLHNNQLTGEIPAELGQLANLQALSLHDNQLTGGIPSELGELESLGLLRLSDNPELSGTLPLALASLSALEAFHYFGTGLCVPAYAPFRAWLNAIPDHQGTGVDCAAGPDRDILEALYHATGGPDWTNSGNWLTGAPLSEWHGVTTDSDGRVVALDLSDNRLAGEIPGGLGGLAGLERLYLQRNQLTGNIPAELGDLARLEQLYLQRNQLSGEIPAEVGDLANLHWLLLSNNRFTGGIPAELGRLARLEGLLLHNNPELSGALPLALVSLSELQSFRYDATAVCVPLDALFRAWLNAIRDHRGTGVDCPPSDRDILEALYHATGGPEWTNSGNWLTHAPLGEWYGVTTDSDGHMVVLDLSDNRLAGGIPPELGGLASLERLYLSRNSLTGEVPSELGQLESLEWLDLRDNQLTGGIPPELGGLASLQIVNLDDNQLMGEIPSELGQLESLRSLFLSNNPDLSGALPLALASLSALEAFHYFGTGLCVPAYEPFRAWLNAIPDHQGTRVDCAASPDRSILEALYHATGGPDWTNSGNWLTGGPLSEWHGVTTDSDGRVVALDLPDNRLTGEIPLELGGLASLERLLLHNNPELFGTLPLTLASLSGLQSFRYDATGVCVPADESFRAWLNAIPDHQGTGVDCAVVNPDRAALAVFYEATRGAGWIENKGWLSDLPLDEWHGVRTGDDGRVIELRLPASNLVGSIPVELADLTSLETLDLERNGLTGRIPPEFGMLSNLRIVNLDVNDLTGGIPSELGGLSNLEVLRLRRNDLTGPVPHELASLRNLTQLGLQRNALEGQLPRGLVGLDRLRSLHFASNAGLCAAGSAEFVTWLARIEVHVGPLCNEEDRAALASLHAAAGGMDWTRSDGWLGDAALEEWHGVTADSAGRVTRLDLSDNGLSGSVPASLSHLGSMVSLRIDGNAALTGPLPLALSQLPLQELGYEGTGLCVPSGSSFAEWLASIATHEGTGVQCAPFSEREILTQVYHATAGTGWTENENWLSDRPLGEWHGVMTGNDGRVIGLNLSANGLSGPIPPELGNLSSLTGLDLSANGLSGPIPPGLGNLSSLAGLDLSANDLSGPIPPELGNLANLVYLWLTNNDLSDPIPPELGSLADLENLSLGINDLSGPIPPELGNLSSLTGLDFFGNDLAGPIPPELGNLASLTSLDLAANDLSGPIPPELGSLASLGYLSLSNNDLSGPIPPELGNLASLRDLRLSANGLSGPIPPELGSLGSLGYLWLTNNDLSGPIPRELGNLASLEFLILSANGLSGPIPPELGNLSSLTYLVLSANDLSGPIPPELGDLSSLTYLSLLANDLSGPIPPELGDLASVEVVELTGNARLSGALPSELTALRLVRRLQLGDTGLCAPADTEFWNWLRGIEIARVRSCVTGGSSVAYLTQAVQSLAHPVPLVAGRPALLRVFITALRVTDARIPPVQATFYIDGTESHRVDVPGSATPIPTEVGDAESALDKSANAEIPASVIRPGLEMVIEIDPANTLDPGLGVTKRIPELGRMPVRVEAMATFDATFIPFVWAKGSDSSLVDIVRGMAADPQGHEMLRDTRALLPVRELDVTAHEPVLTSTTNVFDLSRQVRLIRAMEGGTGYYMGLLPESVVGGQSGVAALGGRTGFSVADPFVIAHEFGHNMGLRHAPCGGAGGPDPAFPEPDGSIGAWGYDIREGTLVAPHARDFMSYCGPPRWVSDYSFTVALSHRLGRDGESGAAAVAQATVGAATRTLLVWGGVDNLGNPFLEPAFVADAAPPTLPRSTGEYELAGRAAGGGELFTLSFGMQELADGDGSSSFVFAIPVQDEWAGELASLTLSGPGGSTTMDRATDRPMAIVRDPASGQIRGILRDPSRADMAGSGVATGVGRGSSMEIAVSRGIPRDGDWGRK